MTVTQSVIDAAKAADVELRKFLGDDERGGELVASDHHILTQVMTALRNSFATLETLSSELERVKGERDAALAQMKEESHEAFLCRKKVGQQKEIMLEAAAALNETLARAERAEASLGVAVKVLEWFPVEAICTREKAQALGGHYSVVEFDKDRPDRHFATNIDLGGLAFVFLLEPDMEFGGTRPKRFSTTEAAKAAAQADYEARVLSALTTPPAREISEAEVERAARAIDALWSEGQDRGPAFEDTEREYQAHCRSTARAALKAARSPS
jgi:hypothetical protein